MKARINKRAVDLATYQGPGGCYLWDDLTPSFGLRIYPSGAKSFVVSYWSKGRRRFYTLGRYGQMTVQQARDSAQEVFAQVRKGKDPSADRYAAHRAPTVADLAERHVREHSEVHKKPKNALKDRQLWQSRVQPCLGKRRVADVTRADLAKLMTTMADVPALGNKVLGLLSKGFALSEVWGWRQEGTNPARGVKRFAEKSRERYLSQSELARLGEVLDRAEREWGTSLHAIAAVRLLILTGCRSSEILKLRWVEVDFERKCLLLADSKTGQRTVLLNTEAQRVLEELEPIEGNPYVIPGNKPGSHRATLLNFWGRIKTEAGIPDVRVHDLRHHYASTAVNRGHSLPVIGKLLGHSKAQTTMRYSHLGDDTLRLANEEVGQELASALTGKPVEADEPAKLPEGQQLAG